LVAQTIGSGIEKTGTAVGYCIEKGGKAGEVITSYLGIPIMMLVVLYGLTRGKLPDLGLPLKTLLPLFKIERPQVTENPQDPPTKNKKPQPSAERYRINPKAEKKGNLGNNDNGPEVVIGSQKRLFTRHTPLSPTAEGEKNILSVQGNVIGVSDSPPQQQSSPTYMVKVSDKPGQKPFRGDVKPSLPVTAIQNYLAHTDNSFKPSSGK
jgi:hypothetical protein